MGCHFLLQEIFPTDGLNLLHWQVDSSLLSHGGNHTPIRTAKMTKTDLPSVDETRCETPGTLAGADRHVRQYGRREPSVSSSVTRALPHESAAHSYAPKGSESAHPCGGLDTGVHSGSATAPICKQCRQPRAGDRINQLCCLHTGIITQQHKGIN